MEPLVLGQWYRITATRDGSTYIMAYHGKTVDGRNIVEQVLNGRFLVVTPWGPDVMNQYTWEPVPVGTLK